MPRRLRLPVRGLGFVQEQLERLAEVVRVVDVVGNLAELLDMAIEHALEASDPQRTLDRRRKREARKAAAEQGVNAAIVSVSSRSTEIANSTETEIAPPVVPSTASSRYVSSELRELVFERASYRCEFVTGDGVQCKERTGLQIDHIVPHGKHGPTELANLRCFCGVHDRWVAEQVYGVEFMRHKIEAARRKRSGVPRGVPSGQVPSSGG